MARGGKREGAGRKPGLASILAEKARAYIAKRIQKEQKPIVDKALAQARAGDRYAREWLYERAYGKAPQPVTGEGGEGPIRIDITAQLDKVYGRGGA